MREIDEEDKAKQEEQHRADEGNVVAVDQEEPLRDEEGHDHETDPENDLRTPEPILQGCSAIFGCPDTEE